MQIQHQMVMLIIAAKVISVAVVNIVIAVIVAMMMMMMIAVVKIINLVKYVTITPLIKPKRMTSNWVIILTMILIHLRPKPINSNQNAKVEVDALVEEQVEVEAVGIAAMIGVAIMLGMVIIIDATMIMTMIVIQIAIINVIDTLEVHAIPNITTTTTNHMDITLTIKATLINSAMEDTKDIKDTLINSAMEATKDIKASHINRAMEATKDILIKTMVDAHVKDANHLTTTVFIAQTMVMKILMLNKTTAITTMMLKDLILEKFGQL